MDDTGIIELYWRRDERAVAETDSKYGAYCRAVSMNILGIFEDRGGVRQRYIRPRVERDAARTSKASAGVAGADNAQSLARPLEHEPRRKARRRNDRPAERAG